MIKLTNRQTEVLKTIIEEYINTAQPVGSETLDKKYQLGVSPATIRNEMVALTEKGLLTKPHVSAGRVPTTLALKFYIRRLMEEEQLGVAEEVALREKIAEYRDQLDRLFQETTRALAEKTNSLAVTVANQEKVYHSGYANILDMPEFFDIDVTKEILSLIEDLNQLNKFFSMSSEGGMVQALIGEDFDLKSLQPCGFVYTNFAVQDRLVGNLGVIGPSRLDYRQVMPTVKYFGNLIEELLGTF